MQYIYIYLDGRIPRNDDCDVCLRLVYIYKNMVSIRESKKYYEYLKFLRVEILKSLEHTTNFYKAMPLFTFLD